MANGAAAAAAARRRREQEEEELTMYSPEDVNQYEFKIVRSVWGTFGNPQRFQQLLKQEVEVGWTLLEKLDNQRIRFKRPISARERDKQLPSGVDPYRTYYGIQPWKFAILVFVVTLVVMFLIFLIFFWIFSQTSPGM